jgi:hypothetical protein
MTGMTLIALDEARVKLTKFAVKNLLVGQQDFIARMNAHYFDDASSEAGKFAF